jgi:hypothetical protein
MPATAPNPTDPLATFTTAALDATSVATEVYLDALDAVAAFQRKLVADTPFAPLAVPFEVQARVARTFLTPVERRGTEAPEAVAEPATAAEDEQTPTAAITAAAKATTRRPRKASTRTTTSRRRTATAKPAPRTAPQAPIAGYDDLTAEEVDARLNDLPQRDLAAVAAYERAHAARSTVLERVERLQEDEPAPGYDDLRAEEAVKLLADADAELAGRVAAYERRHRARTTVLEAADRRREQQ